MTIRDIVCVPDERLRQKANIIKQFNPALKQLAEDMFETMQCSEGVGLAGPQIGIMQRIFVARIPPPENDVDEPHPHCGVPYVLINPEITNASRILIEGKEGCLSIPGWTGLVERPEWVAVRAKDVEGQPIKLKVSGLLARIFMHEIDHLNGVLYTDYISDEENLWEIEVEEAVVQPTEKLTTTH